MPEFCRRTVSSVHPLVAGPALTEGEELPAGLSDRQRLALTQGRLCKDYGMGIKLATG